MDEASNYFEQLGVGIFTGLATFVINVAVAFGELGSDLWTAFIPG